MPKIIFRLLQRLFLLCLSCLILSGCLGPYIYQKNHSHPPAAPSFVAGQAIMTDSYQLPVSVQSSSSPPKAIVLALHGFNDYRNAFHDLGNYLAEKNISLIAYDQRGFGETEGRGYWHGTETMVRDLLSMIRLVSERYPDIPIYLLGESMGGAVILVASQSLRDLAAVRGIILVAPAIWAYRTMPWYQRTPLWFLAHALPWFSLSNQGLDIVPSDNYRMLVALGRDPLVIKGARADTLYGLTLLMSEALAASATVQIPALILYGKKDEIVPTDPTCEMVRTLPPADNAQWDFVLYENGYHMLTRDIQAEQVFHDIERWITTRELGEWQKSGISEQDLEYICQ